MKIGLAVTTTPCRESVFNKWYEQYKKHVPDTVLFIHNDNDYKGIVYSKNKCINTLYEHGVEQMFLFDDDLLIQSPDFISWYTGWGYNHGCWNYNRKLLRFGGNHEYGRCDYYAEYDKPNGCMLYIRREVVDVVGGFDTDFNGYGYEHVNFSDRVFNNQLTPARYIDAPNSSRFFRMADCDTSVSYSIRASTIPINERLYKEKFYSKEFKPFK